MKTREDDIRMHRALMHLLDQGTFELKGKEAPAFGLIYKWVKELGQRLQEKEDGDK